jgi:hypothetical protein
MQAVETLNTKDNLNIVDAKEELFKDYGSMLDKFYSSFKPHTIQKNHIFKVEHTDATLSMQCAIHNEASFVMQTMLKKGQELGAARRDAIYAYKLDTLKAPGLRPIKQVELYKKFQTFVPRCYWDETCPRPSDKVLAMVKNETAERWKQKQVPKSTTLVAAATNTKKAAISTNTKKAATPTKKRAAPTKDTSSKKPKEAPGRTAKKQCDSDSDWSV